MNARIGFLLALFSVVTTSSTVWAAEKDLMSCALSNGGVVQVSVNSSRQLDLNFDSKAQAVLKVANAFNLTTTMEAVNSGGTSGPIDFLESGAGYDGDGGVCGMGLDFLTSNIVKGVQVLGDNRNVPLKPGTGGYKMVTCGQASLGIVSCQASPSLASVSALKRSLNIEEGD